MSRVSTTPRWGYLMTMRDLATTETGYALGPLVLKKLSQLQPIDTPKHTKSAIVMWYNYHT